LIFVGVCANSDTNSVHKGMAILTSLIVFIKTFVFDFLIYNKILLK
jgi:hypothetical protein